MYENTASNECQYCGSTYKVNTKQICQRCRNSYKAHQRQKLTMNSGMKVMPFKSRCKTCNARMCKEVYYVPLPVHPEIMDAYRLFYKNDTECSVCDPNHEATPYKSIIEKHGGVRYRGRGG